MTVLIALLADVVCVLLFAGIGRVSHGEALTLAGLGHTAWPFLAGCVLGTLFAAMRGRPSWVGPGLLVWLHTVVVGLVLRAATGGGTQLSFVIVTAIVLGVFLLGWRAIHAFVMRKRQPLRGPSTSSGGGAPVRTRR